jgi:membrane protease YdiL (CAAX protease family)
VLAVLAAWTFMGNVLADRMRAAAHPDRLRFYATSMLFEWLLFLFVLAGVRRSGVSIRSVLGDRWHSLRQVLRDIGIGLGFWIVSIPVLGLVGWLLRIAGHGPNLESMLPHRAVEVAWWVALSVTAGICEETVFRGYLQRQFLALTKSAPAAILISAATFGVAHAYQGFRMVILISVFGAMFGLLAYWRGTVRPGMIAHGWQDALNGVLASVMKH